MSPLVHPTTVLEMASPGPVASRARVAGGGFADREDERGFSLLELLVASLMAVLVVGGILFLLTGLQDVHRNQQELIDAQQGARLALDQMERDLRLAGVGLASMLAPLPVVVPRADGGVELLHNQGGVTTFLTQDMTGAGSALDVDDPSGFEAGMTVAVYDSSGTLDLATLTSVDTGTNQLFHDGASKAYTVAAGTSISRIQTIAYELQPVNGVLALLRRVDGDPPQPVALNVAALDLTYLDDDEPPQPFAPVTVADRLRIRAIEIELTIQTENVRLNTDQVRTVTLATRVTPRAIQLST